MLNAAIDATCGSAPRSRIPLACRALIGVASLLLTSVARADDASQPTIQITQWNWASGYNLFNPTPDDKLRSFNPDRPTKSTSPITVDAGRFQIESDLLEHTYSNNDGVKTHGIQALDPVYKLGIFNNMDFEIQFNGFQSIRQHDAATGALVDHGSGFGDVIFRPKINLIGNDGGSFSLGVAPYVLLPSGTRLISDGVVEGGFIVPTTYTISEDYSINFTTEVDALKNSNDSRRHANFVNIVTFNANVPNIKDLTAAVEFYSAAGTDRYTPPIYTFDAVLTYLLTPTLQVDVGAYIGLNNAAPNLQVFTGVAKRF